MTFEREKALPSQKKGYHSEWMAYRSENNNCNVVLADALLHFSGICAGRAAAGVLFSFGWLEFF